MGNFVAAAEDGRRLLPIHEWLVIWLVVAWVITCLAGGTRTSAPHLFYVPVIVAAVRVGPIHTLTVSVAAGLVCGPLMLGAFCALNAAGGTIGHGHPPPRSTLAPP